MTYLRLPIFTLFLTVLLFGCSKDDDSPGDSIKTDADPELLYGTWAIFQGELDGKVVDIPPTSPACGRDFFAYSPDGAYREYIFYDNGQCQPEVSELNWELRNGVLTLRDQIGQSAALTIVDLSSSRFIFRTEIDWDEDGTLDTFTFTARPYNPPSFEDISTTFQHNFETRDRIEFNWLPYQGLDFSRYEIYRSTSCEKQDAQLVAIIGEPQTSTFIDESPEAAEQLCYFIRVYTADGLLGESDPLAVLTDELEIPVIPITNITANGEQIEFSWEAFSGYYFSKYEIYVRNYEDGLSGYAFQKEKIAEVTDATVTRFTDTNPPYLRNPIYEVRVVNLFGNSNNLTATGGREVTYERPGLLPMSSIYKWTFDKDEPTLYLLGNSSTDNQQNLVRFNYQTNETQTSNNPPNTSSAIFMKIVDSDFGKELLLQIGGDIYVYDTQTMALKYRLEDTMDFIYITDIDFLGNGIWLVADSDNLYTFTRSEQTLSKLNEENLTFNTQNAGQFQIVRLGGPKVLVGHQYALESYVFEVDLNGAFSNKRTFNTIAWDDSRKTLLYNEARDVVLDNLDRGIYETENFSFVQFYTRPFLATALSRDGNFVLGTDNDPSWTIDETSLHVRNATRYNLSTNTPEDIATVGYPLVVFETSLNQTVCISSWFKRQGLFGYTPKPDLFVEIIE